MDATREPSLSGNMNNILAHKVITLGTLKIGVFSIISPAIVSTSSVGKNVRFDTLSIGSNATVPTSAIIGNQAKILRQSLGCNLVIMIIDESVDALILKVQSVSGVDLVLTSKYKNTNGLIQVASFPLIHDTYFSTPNSPDRFMIAGTADYYGNVIIKMSLNFSSAGVFNISASTASKVLLTNATQSSATGDLAAWNYVKAKYNIMTAAQLTPISFTAEFVNGARGTNMSIGNAGCRFSDCPMGRLLTAAIAQWCPSCDAVMINSGGIRSSFSVGAITTQNVISVLPFTNTIGYFNILGSGILSALINMAAKGLGNGAFLQVSGMRFAWNPDRSVAASQAILEVEMYDKSVSAYVALDILKIYKIATFSYLRNGGDDYTMFASQAIDPFDYGPTDAYVLASYLQSFNSSVSRPLPGVVSSANLTACFTTASIPLSLGAGDCRIVATNGASDLRNKCPSQPQLCQRYLGDGSGGMVVDSFYVNSSSCDRCSGLGSCRSQRCTCAVPTSGLFAGLPIVSGADCGQVRTVQPLSNAIVGALYFVGVVTLLLSVGTAATLAWKMSSPMIAATAPRIGVITCVGSLFASAGIFLLAQPVTSARCQSWLWLTSLSYSLMFSSMFVRTYRIDKIFNSPTLKVHVITDAYLVQIICAIIVVDVAILTWWQVASPFVATGALIVSDTSSLCVICASSSSGYQLFSLFVYKAAQTLWGIYLAYSVRDVQDNFNESRFIGISIYNCSIFCFVILPIIYTIQDSRPDVSTLLKGLLAAYINTFTLVCLYGHRFYLLYIGEDMKGTGVSNLTLSRRGSTKGTKEGAAGEIQLTDSSSSELTRLRAEVSQLKSMVTELRAQLVSSDGTISDLRARLAVSESGKPSKAEFPVASHESNGISSISAVVVLSKAADATPASFESSAASNTSDSHQSTTTSLSSSMSVSDSAHIQISIAKSNEAKYADMPKSSDANSVSLPPTIDASSRLSASPPSRSNAGGGSSRAPPPPPPPRSSLSRAKSFSPSSG